MTLIKVAVDAPLLEPLTYKQASEFKVERGQVVNVQLGQRHVKGFVLGEQAPFEKPPLNAKGEPIDFKPIVSIDEEWPLLQDPYLKWLEWISEYYIHPPGQVMKAALPPLRRSTRQNKSKRPPVIPQLEAKAKPELTAEQKQCVEHISVENGFKTHLIHGVTGSGKTEVYLRLFEKVLTLGKKGLFLLPEISLTPQLTHRFVERFGDQVAVLHSQLTDRERTNQWWEIIEGKKNILVGARSALFCPIENLGLIVVDEEHETSFKQDEKLKYNGRDCAIMLGKLTGCPVLLGSATPSLETWKNAQEGKFQLHSLLKRVSDRPLPSVKIVDMRLEKENTERKEGTPFWLSNELLKEMSLCLERQEQVALLLNRRGLAQAVFCTQCGYTEECPNCEISLTLHAKHHLICHYCNYHQNYNLKCPDCSEGELKPMGLGTEKVEEDLLKIFPNKIIARADRDEITNRLEMTELIEKMEKGEIDILIGTQMIAKGLDFPKLKLVGLLLADVGFNLPDFRSSEKSFQLMTQMSGRAGRHVTAEEQPGQVFIQAYNTEHESLKYAQNHDFLGFAEAELLNRAPLAYPPFSKLTSFRIQSLSQEKASATAYQLQRRAAHLKEKYSQHYAGIEILGPASSPLAKINNQYRFHVLLKGTKAQELNQFARQVLADEKWIPSQVKVLVDIDPLSLL